MSGTVTIHGKEYKTVALRVQEFRTDHPDWAIITSIVESTDERVVMKAEILAVVETEGGDRKGYVIGTGYAEEVRGSSQINRTSALENCETSAIGRALAASGYGGTEYASANEVENAIHQQQPPVKIDPKIQKEFIQQVTDCLLTVPIDEDHLKELWAEWDVEEKSFLWSKFNSQQRSQMKELTK